MYLDILIFAVIAAILIYRLNAVLGTRHGEEKTRPNPFAADETISRTPQAVLAAAPPKTQHHKADVRPFIDSAADKDGRIGAGLEEISAADPSFDVGNFMTGARYAFETIVTAYSKGDRDRLRPLLSPGLYAGFESGISTRESLGHVSTTEIRRIKAARIVAAHLGGAMAYITVDYDVEQTTVVRDRNGAIVEGNPDSIANVEDIWTFTRDIRSSDPNWILMETRAAEK